MVSQNSWVYDLSQLLCLCDDGECDECSAQHSMILAAQDLYRGVLTPVEVFRRWEELEKLILLRMLQRFREESITEGYADQDYLESLDVEIMDLKMNALGYGPWVSCD